MYAAELASKQYFYCHLSSLMKAQRIFKPLDQCETQLYCTPGCHRLDPPSHFHPPLEMQLVFVFQIKVELAERQILKFSSKLLNSKAT